MDWVTILEYLGKVVSYILGILFLCTLFFIILCVVLYVLDIIIKIIRWLLLKLFDIELNVGDLVLKFIDCLSSIWTAIKNAGKKIWVGFQIVIVLVVVFLFFFGIPLLDRCTRSEPKYHDEEEIEYIDDATPPRGVPSRYW